MKFFLGLLLLLATLAWPTFATRAEAGGDPYGNRYQWTVAADGSISTSYVNDDVENPGQVSQQLSQSFYCQTKQVMSGNLGLLVGLVLALMGLYQMVSGSLMGGLILLISGALVTALPSLAESFLKGVGSFLQDTKIGSQTFQPPPGC